MTMVFRYYQDKTPQPALALGGRTTRPRPVLAVTVLGPLRSRLVEAHLDTGSDDTVFPESVARLVGISLSGAPQARAVGIGNVPAVLRFANVALRIAGGRERREWNAWVAFTSVPMHRPVLGFAGFLQFFTATFYGDREVVELTVNGLYPGT
jgi:hypothetical protein